MKVCKFGGTSVGTVERMKHVAELISESTPKIVVLSATAGTTNHLEEIAANLFNRDIEQAHEKITRMEFQFIDFANELLTDESTKREAIDYILDRFQRLWQFINDEFTSVEEKEVLAQGELISTALLHFYLRERKIANILLSAFDFMRTGPEGEPDLKYIEEKLQAQLAQYPGINLFITQGYICKNAYNETDNLKRGGSDYTASLIGAAIRAEEIQIWTDIDGMHNNDPREVTGTRSVKHLSFNEAEQLAFYGAKILHPFCIAPARKRNIPVRLLSSMNPQAEGTLISDLQDDNIIKAIAAKDNIFYVNILIQKIHETVRGLKPWVKFGVSPFGIYRNQSSDPLGSATNGLQNYDDLYADVLLWARKGWIDYNIPQVYWQIGHPA
jgi:aspartate kinase